MECMPIEEMNKRLSLSPFSAWIGLRVDAYEDAVLRLSIAWRDEFLGRPDSDIVHGGVIATVVDTASGYACATVYGKPLATVDLRLDFHRPCVRFDVLRIEARVTRSGKRLAWIESKVISEKGDLVATGKALFSV